MYAAYVIFIFDWLLSKWDRATFLTGAELVDDLEDIVSLLVPKDKLARMRITHKKGLLKTRYPADFEVGDTYVSDLTAALK